MTYSWIEWEKVDFFYNESENILISSITDVKLVALLQNKSISATDFHYS